MEVRQIDAKDTLHLRNKILRPGSNIDECQFDGDNSEQTFHLGAYVDDKLVSIASFYMENNEKFNSPFQYRLRGMATLSDFRGQGISSSLLKTGFSMIKKNNVPVIWCNARTEAFGFYEKMQFEKCSDEFEIQGVGPHFLMRYSLIQTQS